MPAYRSSRRALRAKPKYTFSDDEDEEDQLPDTKTRTERLPHPTPYPSFTIPARSSHARKRPEQHVPRPRNAFIIFRSEFNQRQKMKENGVESDHRQISRIAAHVWNNLPDAGKQPYWIRSDIEKAEHKAAYPEYQYTPVSRPNPVKRKAKRDSTEEEVRCRQLAELIISGVDGKEFQQAAKDLDQGVVEVKLTQRTSKPAPKQRYRRDKRRPTRAQVSKRGFPAELDITAKSPSPSRDSSLPAPSPSSDARLGSPYSDGSFDTPALSPCESKSSDDSRPSLQLSPYRSPILPSPALSSIMEPEQASNPYLRLSPSSNLTLAALYRQGSSSTLSAMHTQKALSVQAPSQDEHRDPTELDWPTPPFSMVGLSGCPSLSVTPPPPSPSPSRSVEYVENSGASVEHSPTHFTLSRDSLWNSTDTDALLAQATEELELCYPDDEDVDFDEYLTGL